MSQSDRYLPRASLPAPRDDYIRVSQLSACPCDAREISKGTHNADGHFMGAGSAFTPPSTPGVTLYNDYAHAVYVQQDPNSSNNSCVLRPCAQ